jgi:hypothetical protein
MRRVRAWAVRLAGMVGGGRGSREREIADELDSHLQMHVEDNLRLGMTPMEALRAAKLQLGGVERTKQACRERGTVPVLESFWQDLRFALRQLRKRPGFTATAILMIALGMGASVAIFAFVDAALIQPMPFRDPARLVSVYETVASCPLCNVSYQNWRDWKKNDDAFSSLEVWGYARYMLRGSEGLEPAMGTRVSDGFFRTLGVAPVLGRDFYAGEDRPGAPRTVLISYGTWQTRFGGRADVVGQVVTLSDIAYTVIGVLPREFHFAPRGESEFWTALNEPSGCDKRRACHGLFGLGRLKDGVSVTGAAANMETMAAQLWKLYPETNHGYGATAIPLSEAVVGEIRPVLLVLLAGAGLLLLIACVNVVSLLLVRAEGRRQEMALRGALGATARRLVRQFATESLVLVLAGSAMGIVGAAGAMRLMLKLIPANRMESMPFLLQMGLSGRVLGFAGLVAVGAAAMFALAPALRLVFSKSDLRGELAENGRGAVGQGWRRLGSRLVMVELATAVVLLVGAGLLGKSLYRLLHVEVGFQPDHLTTVVVAVPEGSVTDVQMMALERQILSRGKHAGGAIGGPGQPFTGRELGWRGFDCDAWAASYVAAKRSAGAGYERGVSEDDWRDAAAWTLLYRCGGRSGEAARGGGERDAGKAVLSRRECGGKAAGVRALDRHDGDSGSDCRRQGGSSGYAQSPGDLCAVQSGLVLVFQPDGADGAETGGGAACDHGHDTSDRFAAGHGGTDDDESGNCRFELGVSASIFGVAGGWVCGGCAGARGSGAVWGDCVLGGAADTGDWGTDGAGRAAGRGVWADLARGGLAGGWWDSCRTDLRGGVGGVDAVTAVWGERLGCFYAGGCGWDVGNCGDGGELSASAAGGWGESCGGSAGGMSYGTAYSGCDAACWSAAMSSFFMVIMARMPAGWLTSLKISVGTTCQLTPNLSLSQPQAISAPRSVSLDQ